jgi:1-acyl-sn-glycerol-3-phosphate acyltransferase
MPDAFYRVVREIGRPVVWVCSRATVLHRERVDRLPGAVLIAPNHLSPYDVPCLMASTKRLLDFVSIAEVFRRPLAGWFLRRMNAFPHDRRRADPATVRKIVSRLERGRTVVLFPEGHVRTPARSLLNGGGFNPSVVRLARVGGAPIVPCVVLGSGGFARPRAWLPTKGVRYGVAFGEAITVSNEHDETAAVEQLSRSYDRLYAALRRATGLTVFDAPWRDPP